ncbi:MAG: sigma-54-dependent Fis family transcriptional regulator [Nitrospiraceae bacterium]|jgi:two-component system nitrogen regulation response regulator NtrX|nr:sigma-54-dependent Fis family transcriptional regulator [Nitrospiraceae bacterium]
MNKKSVLIVDDEAGIRESMTGIFEDEGFAVMTAASGEEALERIAEKMPDLVFLDVWLPEMDGIETLERLKEQKYNLPVVMMSGHGNIEIAVKATRHGAYDFLEKPFSSIERVMLVARLALERQRLEEENLLLRADAGRRWHMVGSSAPMLALREQIALAAQGSARVLILGESGTGKELVARVLHEQSPRAMGAFIEVNCAAIPQELIESELFGHEKGSFTGALERKIGKFELANNGTLFLDEIGDMSLQTQAKVLRIMETQEFQRVGGSKNIKVDVRIIAATNKNLMEEVKKGAFREDLFYRLNVIPITVPPLRDRSEDIPELVEYFAESFAAENGLRPKRFDDHALRVIQEHPWPGNIRELKNAVERLVIMVPGQDITRKQLETLGILQSPEINRSGGYFAVRTLREARDLFERDFIIHKLQENAWNVSRTAELIGIERSNLHKKMRAFGITESKEQDEQ